MRMKEEARKGRMREMQIQHEEKLRQAYASQRASRMETQESDKEQEIEDEENPEDLDILSRKGSAESVFVPEYYRTRMPIGLSRSANRVV